MCTRGPKCCRQTYLARPCAHALNARTRLLVSLRGRLAGIALVMEAVAAVFGQADTAMVVEDMARGGDGPPHCTGEDNPLAVPLGMLHML
jgi:hypothetical protein